MFFKKERSKRLLTTGNGIRYWLSPLQWICIGVILWTMFCVVVLPSYKTSFIIIQTVCLYLLIMDGVSKSMDDHKK